jgi:hypothetical protein
VTDESHAGNLPIPGPADREHFLAAQARNRRATWRLSALPRSAAKLVGRWLKKPKAIALATSRAQRYGDGDPRPKGPMKKAVIGCVIVMALLGVAAAVASYMAYRKVTATVAGFSQLGTVPELDRSIRTQASYDPPRSGEPSQAQVERLVQVQQAVRARLGTRVGEFERKYHTLLQKDSAAVTDIPALVSAYSDLAAGYVDAKRVQVEALNEAGFSLEEYRWVKRQTYGALGMPMMDLDVARMVTYVKNGRAPVQPDYRLPVGPTGSPASQKLVEPYRKTLEANAGIAFFGL